VCGSEIAHHLQDLAVVDAGAVPLHPVWGLPDVASDHALGHTAHELLPRGLAVAAELYTRLGGIVEELIVLNPESDVPGFVVGPTVEIKSGVGHGSFRLVCVNSTGSPAQWRSLMFQLPDWHSAAGKGNGRPSANAWRLAAERAIMALCC
jgi:hypothetical protein